MISADHLSDQPIGLLVRFAAGWYVPGALWFAGVLGALVEAAVVTPSLLLALPVLLVLRVVPCSPLAP